MARIVMDGRPLEVPDGTTLLQAALASGIDIPHFCWHPALGAEGSCRMCLVEITGWPKLELACSTKAQDGMSVATSSPPVLEARRSILEMLLAEHPLDCPVCDKAGECRLQDYYEVHGLFKGQFKESKEKKDKKAAIGRTLLLDRERCILCTRCVRFLRAVTKTGELGVFDRGVRAEVGIFEGRPVDNNYSGNLAEVCPVGAITDSDFRFKTRAWFLKKGNSICPFCGRGCAIRLDFVEGYPLTGRQRKIFRVRAVENPEVNGFWICDVGRYSYPAYEQGRLSDVYWKKGSNSRPSWETVTTEAAEKIRGLLREGRADRLAVVLSSRLTDEALFLARMLFMDSLGISMVFRADPPAGKPDGLLLTEDRVPNRRGAAEIGIPDLPPDLQAIAGRAEVLLVFGNDLAEGCTIGDVRTALEKVAAKYLLAAHQGPLDDLFDARVPVPMTPETEGSYTNVQGKVQGFRPVFEAPRGSVAEWRFLIRLATELEVDRKRPIFRASSLLTVREEMAKAGCFGRGPDD